MREYSIREKFLLSTGLIIAALAAPSLAVAQTEPTKAPDELSEVVLTGSMLATAAALLGGTALAAEPAELPPGPGRDLTVKTCVRCHQADVITRRRMSRPEWKDMVDVMVRMGAPANAKQKAEIVKYLSKALPPATSAVAKAVPKAGN